MSKWKIKASKDPPVRHRFNVCTDPFILARFSSKWRIIDVIDGIQLMDCMTSIDTYLFELHFDHLHLSKYAK